MKDYKINKEISFRYYQTKCLDDLEKYYKNNNSGIICIPTGGGKTIIFSKFSQDKKTIIISHTEELVTQAKSKYEFINHIECGIANANNWNINHDSISASVQTLYSRIESKEFQELIKDKEYLIVDEAHHFPADSYNKVYLKIKEYNPNIKLLGVTATPFRSDNVELKEYFDEMIFNVSIKNLIKDEYLVPTKAKIIRIPETLAKFNNIKIRRDSNGITDYSLKSLSNVLGATEVLNYVVDNFIKEYNNRKTIFFTTNIEVSKNLVEKLKEKNVNAVHIDGTISKKERNNIIEDYRNGDIEVLSNVNILTEGFDDPSTECIALLRPTKSLNLYAQIIGRGLRPSPETNKEDCLVLDFTPATSKFSKDLANLFELFELEADENSRDYLSQFTISSNKNGLLVNFGTDSEELELFNNQIHLQDYIVNINDKNILSCGREHHLLISQSKDEHNLNQIELINTLSGEIEYIKGIPDNIIANKIYEIWDDISNKKKIEKDLKIRVLDEDLENTIEFIKKINRSIFNIPECNHNHMLLENKSMLEEMNPIHFSTYKKYLIYLNNFVYTDKQAKKQVICEDLSINYSNVKFDNFKQLLTYYKDNIAKIEFENELIGDFVKYLAPIEDDEWIPESSFITKRRKDSFTFKIMVDNKFKEYIVEYNDNKDKLIYKHILLYISERISHIRKNKSNNTKYYRVPTIKYLKDIRPVTKKLNCYQDIKYLLKFK